MTKASNPYLLPHREPLPRGVDTFEPKRFKLLLEELPMGNVGQVAQTLQKLLKQMNAAAIPVSARVSNMELLLEPLLSTLDSLKKSFSREHLPLSKRPALIAELFEELCILSAQAYKVILDQYHHESLAGHLLHKSNRAMALHRVLYFLGLNLLQAYLLYRPAPLHIWREIHGIHRYAFDQKLAERPVDNETRAIVGQSSVNDLYKQLLLLSLSGPYRLMQGDVQRVYMALMRWAPKAQLTDLGKSNGDEGQYIVDIGVDEPPRFRGADRDRQVLKGWVLDSTALAVYLADELEASAAPHGVMRPQGSPDKISPDLLARLMLTWGIGSQRVTDRDQTPGEVSMICGLEAIYSVLGGEPLPEQESKPGAFNADNPLEKKSAQTKAPGVPRSLLESDEHVIYDDPELNTIRQWINESNDSVHKQERDEPENMPLPEKVAVEAVETVEEIVEEPKPLSRNCLVYDESVSGYHLGWTGGSDEQITVGELVAVVGQDGHDASMLRLGVIRWMQAGHPDVIDFGVELFPGEITPVLFSRKWGRSKLPTYCPGLLQQRPNEDPTLITSPFYSEENEKSWLTQQGEKKRVMLTRVIEATASFIQLYYLDPEAEAQQASGKTEFDEQDFDQLWTSL
ncbi:MAG: hypothetical protein OQL20_09960 [Sedimenticola sp.]|nr:hypothetical protein [Sedimenticola sp.]